MSCIVAYKGEDGTIVVGADSRISSGSNITHCHFSKLLRRSGALWGFIGDCRFMQIVEWQMEFPEALTEEWLFKEFPKKLMDLLGEHRFGDNLSVNPAKGGQIMVVFDGEIYIVHSDYCILKSDQMYEAIGSGERYALGALRAVWNEVEALPGWYCEKALAAASFYRTDVSPPFRYEIVR